MQTKYKAICRTIFIEPYFHSRIFSPVVPGSLWMSKKSLAAIDKIPFQGQNFPSVAIDVFGARGRQTVGSAEPWMRGGGRLHPKRRRFGTGERRALGCPTCKKKINEYSGEGGDTI